MRRKEMSAEVNSHFRRNFRNKLDTPRGFAAKVSRSLRDRWLRQRPNQAINAELAGRLSTFGIPDGKREYWPPLPSPASFAFLLSSQFPRGQTAKNDTETLATQAGCKINCSV